MEMSHRGKEFIGDRRRGRGGPARAARHPGELQGAVPAGRRDAAVRADADEPAARQGQGRLREHRRVVEEGDQGGEEATARSHVAATSEDRNFTYAPKQWNVKRPDAAYVHYCSNETIGGVEFHCDSRHRRRAAGGRRVLAHPVAAARRVEVRPDLRRRAEEHRARRADHRHRARRPASARRAEGHADGDRLQGCRPRPTRCSTRRRPTRSTSPAWCSSG